MTTPQLHREMERWIFDDALPFWADVGVDRTRGGFVEDLTIPGADAAQPFKRTRVACRQVYSFSHALALGWEDGRMLVDHGVDYLVRKAWNGSSFARRLTREGDILDPTPDLYDHAFALFAFAHAHLATGDAHHRVWIDRTMDAIDEHFRAAGGGFHHERPPTGTRNQNPHMHLFEAAIAAFDATGDSRFESLATELFDLFMSRLFQRGDGTLGEFFDDGWRLAASEKGRIREPGHQFEWVWILSEANKRFDLDARPEMRSLQASARALGVNPATGAVYNAVTPDGAVLDGGSRSWTNTERLKCAIAIEETLGIDMSEEIDRVGRLILDKYLTAQPGYPIPRGGWIDSFDMRGQPDAAFIPASILYHLLLAFSETIRLRDVRAARGASLKS